MSIDNQRIEALSALLKTYQDAVGHNRPQAEQDRAWDELGDWVVSYCDIHSVLWLVARVSASAHLKVRGSESGTGEVQLVLAGVDDNGRVINHGVENAPPVVAASARFVSAAIANDQATADAIFHAVPSEQLGQFVSLIRQSAHQLFPRYAPAGGATT